VENVSIEHTKKCDTLTKERIINILNEDSQIWRFEKYLNFLIKPKTP
jgi:hypothetical protein